MATDIAACRAKLARTNEYLTDFSASSQAWGEAEADKIVHDYDTDTGKYLIVLKKAPVTPSRLAIVIGDAFHSLRSCLDLLVYALAVHESKEEPFREEPVRDADWLSSLLVLDKLNNIYKHRRLSIVAMKPGVMLGVGATHPGLAIAGIRPPGPLEDDAVLMTCVVADKNPDMTVVYDPTFDVCLDEPDVVPGHPNARELLVTIGNDVQAVVNRFEMAFF